MTAAGTPKVAPSLSGDNSAGSGLRKVEQQRRTAKIGRRNQTERGQLGLQVTSAVKLLVQSTLPENVETVHTRRKLIKNNSLDEKDAVIQDCSRFLSERKGV